MVQLGILPTSPPGGRGFPFSSSLAELPGGGIKKPGFELLSPAGKTLRHLAPASLQASLAATQFTHCAPLFRVEVTLLCPFPLVAFSLSPRQPLLVLQGLKVTRLLQKTPPRPPTPGWLRGLLYTPTGRHASFCHSFDHITWNCFPIWESVLLIAQGRCPLSNLLYNQSL